MRGTARVRADCVVAQWAMECDIYPRIAPVSTVTIGAGLAPPPSLHPGCGLNTHHHPAHWRLSLPSLASHGGTAWQSDILRRKRQILDN